MKSKPIKSTKLKTATNQETKVHLEQEIKGLEIQANELQNRILKRQRELLDFNEDVGEVGSFDDCVIKDFPDD